MQIVEKMLISVDNYFLKFQYRVFSKFYYFSPSVSPSAFSIQHFPFPFPFKLYALSFKLESYLCISMPQDIFISYSSKDKEKADQLSELLASAGLSVWIDQTGIDAATSWSKEIVQAIDGCKAFVVLLSPNSLCSSNVMKEVSLAAEQKKKILPLDLEPVELNEDFRYHLAGIQRAPMTNIDAIIRALGKLGLEATSAPTLKIVKETDSRKSLMILPFEDLSPTGDNGWFADGLVAELISALSNVKALRVSDAQSTKEFKSYKGQLAPYAHEMSIRYFIEGSVRKFGDQIKISTVLLDIESGDHLWQDSMKGTMDDIFDIQEKVAEKVVEGLKVHLASDEKKKLAKRGTESAEAYELLLKAKDYYNRSTRSDVERALTLFEEVVSLDPGFAMAYAMIANTCAELNHNYGRSEALLERAEAAAGKVKEVEGETAQYFRIMGVITHSRGDAEGALDFVRRAVNIDPAYAQSYDTLGIAYQTLGRHEEAVQAREEFVRLRENYASGHFKLLTSLNELAAASSPEAKERLNQAAERAIPVFERHMRLNPDDHIARFQFATVYSMADRAPEAFAEAEKLSAVESLDGNAVYNLACLYLHLQDTERGMAMLTRSIEKGFRAIETFRHDPDLDPLRGTPEFDELMKEVAGDSISPTQTGNTN